MIRWKSTLAVLLALWLPFQGYGAVAMPYCQNKASGASATGDQVEGRALHDHHDHAGTGDHRHVPGPAASPSHDSELKGPHVQTGKTTGLACNNCGMCLLACSPLISAVLPTAVATGGSVYVAVRIAELQSFFPERPQRPPLPALV
jgi:hypothetical protein